MNVPHILAELMRVTGWQQETLAEKLRTTQSQVSRWLAGREPRQRSLERIKKLALAHGIGEEPAADHPVVVPIMGYVGAGGDVEPEFEQVPYDGLEQIEIPERLGLVDDPIGFRVTGESMMPRYNDGDVVIVEREQMVATDSMLGDEAVVRTYDGHRFIKRIKPGAKRHTYNLVSLRDGPTIEGVRIVWASAVRLIIPNVGLRRVAPRHRAPVRDHKERRR